MPATSEQLASQFQRPGLRFETDASGLVKAVVETAASSGELYLQGAHVTKFTPTGNLPVLWLSEISHFAAGKPIRGGVPICFPWFGPHASNADAPAHGPARVAEWQLTAAELLASGGIALTLFAHIEGFDVSYRAAFDQDLQLSLQVRLGDQATQPANFEEALHSYFDIADIHQISIEGLEDAAFIDKVDNAARKPSSGTCIRFDGECDRVYLNTTSTCKLQDHARDRCIIISKTGSMSTVVWNPWIAKSARMPDFGNEEWLGMVCIESANVGANAIRLGPGKTHELLVRISVQ